jgi:hypothetical protein
MRSCHQGYRLPSRDWSEENVDECQSKRTAICEDETNNSARVITHTCSKACFFQDDSQRSIASPNSPTTPPTAYSVSSCCAFCTNASSYLRSSSRSTHPPLGNGLSHRLCKCTAKIFCSARSSPPPSSKPYPSAHCPSARSGVNGSGTLLSSRQARGSLKQNGRILKGGIDAARRRRQSRR